MVQWLVHLLLLLEHLARIPCLPPSSYSPPLPSWCLGVELRRGYCTMPHSKKGPGSGKKGPQRSNPAAVKGISWYVPTLSLTKSQVILENLQDHLLICTDISNASSPACSKKREPGALRTSFTVPVFCDPRQDVTPLPLFLNSKVGTKIITLISREYCENTPGIWSWYYRERKMRKIKNDEYLI